MSDLTPFRRELRVFLDARHLPDIWTWLMLPEDAARPLVVERLEERRRWAERQGEQPEYRVEAVFLLTWFDDIEEELLGGTNEWDTGDSTVVEDHAASEARIAEEAALLEAELAAELEAEMEARREHGAKRLRPARPATPRPMESSGGQTFVMDDDEPTHPGSRRGPLAQPAPVIPDPLDPMLSIPPGTPPAMPPMPMPPAGAMSRRIPVDQPPSRAPWIVGAVVVAVLAVGGWAATHPTETPPASTKPTVTARATPAPSVPVPGVPTPNTAALVGSAPPSTAPVPTPAPVPTAAPSTVPAAATTKPTASSTVPAATGTTTTRPTTTTSTATTSTATASTAAPADVCIAQRTFAGDANGQGLSLTVTGIKGKGVTATAKVIGADGSRSLSLIGTCSGGSLRLLGPAGLTITGTVAEGGLSASGSWTESGTKSTWSARAR